MASDYENDAHRVEMKFISAEVGFDKYVAMDVDDHTGRRN